VSESKQRTPHSAPWSMLPYADNSDTLKVLSGLELRQQKTSLALSRVLYLSMTDPGAG